LEEDVYKNSTFKTLEPTNFNITTRSLVINTTQIYFLYFESGKSTFAYLDTSFKNVKAEIS